MKPPTVEQAAIAAVVAFADLIAEGAWPNASSEVHSLLHQTDLWTVALLAAIIVDRLGLAARDVLKDLGIDVALSAS
jgi:hypothetical protein